MSCFIWEMWFLGAFPKLSLWSIMGRWQRWSKRRWWILVQGDRCHYHVLSRVAWETLPLYKMAAAPQHGSGWKEQKTITFWRPAQNVETFICCLCVCVCSEKLREATVLLQWCLVPTQHAYIYTGKASILQPTFLKSLSNTTLIIKQQLYYNHINSIHSYNGVSVPEGFFGTVFLHSWDLKMTNEDQLHCVSITPFRGAKSVTKYTEVAK